MIPIKVILAAAVAVTFFTGCAASSGIDPAINPYGYNPPGINTDGYPPPGNAAPIDPPTIPPPANLQ